MNRVNALRMNEYLVSSAATEPWHEETGLEDEVHLLMREFTSDTAVSMHFDSPRGLATLVEQLVAHYRHVWPDADLPDLHAPIARRRRG